MIPPPVLSIAAPLRQGGHGPFVRLAQEWLALRLANPYPARVDDRPLECAVDGDFGPATEAVVRRFQRGLGLHDSGEIDQALFAQLVQPMAVALLTPLARATLGETVVATAEVHLKQGPREVGGDNHGPWVRLYADGAENLPWCAAFATSVIRQAATLMAKPCPVPHELACDSIAHDADLRGALIHGSDGAPPVSLKPGSLFLVKAAPGADRKYHHTGIVSAVFPDRIETVEGNTNADGSPNGYGVFARERRYRGLDFVSLEAA